jgi:hypothetical protein
MRIEQDRKNKNKTKKNIVENLWINEVHNKKTKKPKNQKTKNILNFTTNK